jgi:hypothetical protein
VLLESPRTLSQSRMVLAVSFHTGSGFKYILAKHLALNLTSGRSRDKILGWKGGTCAAINAIVNWRRFLSHCSLWRVGHTLARARLWPFRCAL